MKYGRSERQRHADPEFVQTPNPQTLLLSPAAEEPAAEPDTPIEFAIVSGTNNVTDFDSVRVTVNEVLVWSGGGALEGWTGQRVALEVGYRYTLNPPRGFVYGAHVNVTLEVDYSLGD